jgi:hypothetical protein
MTLHVVVTGGRTYRLTAEDYAWLATLGITHLRDGGAPGADDDAWRWAQGQGISTHSYAADWKRQGRGAGPVRNGKMLHDLIGDQRELGIAIALVTFPGGRGTRNCTDQARALGIPVLSRSDERTVDHEA